MCAVQTAKLPAQHETAELKKEEKEPGKEKLVGELRRIQRYNADKYDED